MGWLVWTPKLRSNFWPVRSRLSWLARCEHHNCLTLCSKKVWLHACVVTPLAALALGRLLLPLKKVTELRKRLFQREAECEPIDMKKSSLVPRPVRPIRVTRGGLEPSVMANFPDKLDRRRHIRNRRERLRTRLEKESFSLFSCK